MAHIRILLVFLLFAVSFSHARPQNNAGEYFAASLTVSYCSARPLYLYIHSCTQNIRQIARMGDKMRTGVYCKRVDLLVQIAFRCNFKLKESKRVFDFRQIQE
jgi:hypothetical protein